MSISDAEYAAWLRADNKERVVLVEAKAFSGGSEVTRYFSNRGFVSKPTDTPASTAYDDILLSIPSLRSVLTEAFTGSSTISYGDTVVDNSSGARDSWLVDSWDGREIRFYLGDSSWAKADFRLVFFGTIEDITAQGNRQLVLRVRDRQRLLDLPVQTTRITAAGEALNKLVPIAYGRVRNVPPVLVDAATRTYRWHDGQVQSVDAVYDDGVAIATYTANLTNGTISLTAAATGVITLDGKGSKTGGVYVDKIADIAARIIAERTQIASGDIDSASVAALNTAAPGEAGIYVAADHTTTLQALDFVLGSAGAYFTVDRLGKVVMGLFEAPSGTPVVTLVDDDIQLEGISLIKRILPVTSVRVGYAKIYATAIYGAAAALTEAQRQRLSQEYLTEYAATGATGFLLAPAGGIAGTPYAQQATAATEATRRAALWGTLRRVFRLRGFLAAQQVRLGDVVELDCSRYGLSGGVLARVVGLNESLTNGMIELEVFV